VLRKNSGGFQHDVTLLHPDSPVSSLKNGEITAHIRFKGGITKTLTVPLPLSVWQQRTTSPEVVREIDRLLDYNTYPQIAFLLNDRGLRSGEGKTFTARIVARVRNRYGLTSRGDRLRKAGMLTVDEMAVMLGITPEWVKMWNRHGLLRGHATPTKTTVCLSIRATIRREKPKASSCPNAAS
jgi:hypothetical protein